MAESGRRLHFNAYKYYDLNEHAYQCIWVAHTDADDCLE